jgi:hypothetical protein
LVNYYNFKETAQSKQLAIGPSGHPGGIVRFAHLVEDDDPHDLALDDNDPAFAVHADAARMLEPREFCQGSILQNLISSGNF